MGSSEFIDPAQKPGEGFIGGVVAIGDGAITDVVAQNAVRGRAPGGGNRHVYETLQPVRDYDRRSQIGGHGAGDGTLATPGRPNDGSDLEFSKSFIAPRTSIIRMNYV
jgi:hypothetical protein